MKHKIHLIRHGKTQANVDRLYCGNTDLSLCEEGRNELLERKQNTVYPVCDYFYCTPLKRTKETGQLIFGHENMVQVDLLSEYNFGDFEMKSYEQLKENPDYIQWIEDTKGVVSCPNGENTLAFKKRVAEGIKQVISNTPKQYKDIAVVTHGGVIACLMEHFFGCEKHFYEWQPACGLGYTLVVDGETVIHYEVINESTD